MREREIRAKERERREKDRRSERKYPNRRQL